MKSSRRKKLRKRKITGLTLCALFFALCLPAQAQQPARIPKIGYLGSGFAIAGPHQSFQREFQKLGYVEGRNVIFIYRFADNKYDRLPALAAELVHLNVDVIITPGSNDT